MVSTKLLIIFQNPLALKKIKISLFLDKKYCDR